MPSPLLTSEVEFLDELGRHSDYPATLASTCARVSGKKSFVGRAST